jgi:DNA-directed RNA polymerase specialized sigma24 family protein
MSMQRFEPEAARDAWQELHGRHSRYVAAVVRRALGERARDEDLVFDVVGDAFHAVFHWTGRQETRGDVAGRFEAHDADSTRRRVLGFLAVVARRLATRSFAGHGRAPHETLCADFDLTAAPEREDTEPPPAHELDKLEAVLELLSSEEAEALRVSLPWYQPETHEFAFPRGEAARVAASLGISTDALRQRRSRSLRRLQSILRRP